MDTLSLVESVRDHAYSLMQELQQIAIWSGDHLEPLGPRESYTLDLSDLTDVKVLG